MMPDAVREGNIHYGERMSQNYYEKVGDFKLGNPLRQFQDEIITAVTLCARAAIEGGIPREKALTMSDSYIREVEEAMTVAEVTAAELPAVYVPLPHGNGEQGLNAKDVIAAGAARTIADGDLTGEVLAREVLDILSNPHTHQEMRRAAAARASNNAAEIIADRVAAALA